MADAEASSRVTAASARFMNALVAMEPGTENSGIYANKPGYHGTRAENDARSGTGKDYSTRAPLDRLGPADKAAAYDWTFHSAQAGNYAAMAKYGDRLEAAFHARDPRLFGWREALGQTDLDKTPEGLDFQGWYTRTPDSTHSWHWHLSEVRAYVESWDNKACMLSVLAGETLAAYLARGGKLLKPITVPPTPPAPAPDWMDLLVKNRLPVLRKGSTGWSVGLLQGILNRHGFALKEDQDYGDKTTAAVLALQKKYGAESKDGVCGPETWTIALTRSDQV